MPIGCYNGVMRKRLVDFDDNGKLVLRDEAGPLATDDLLFLPADETPFAKVLSPVDVVGGLKIVVFPKETRVGSALLASQGGTFFLG